MKLGQFGRLLQINHVLGRHRLDELILAIHFFRPYRFLSWFSPYRWRHKADLPRGERIRLALQDLGPIFVKFGQILSTRRDLLPEDIALALIHAAYEEGEPERIFSHIDTEPLASASIAQVHAATLTDGKQVILKLVRPGIEKVIRRDVDLLYTLAGLAEKYWSEGKRLRPREVDERLLYVPEVYWSLTKPNLLVQERVFGAPISNIALLKQHNINLELLATIGVEIFFTQVFRHSFFHADMHPGNILVDVNNPQLPRYIAIDFGIMGTLSPDDQRYLAENFLAFFNHDYRRVAELHIQSGWVPAETRMDEFESAIRSVCEPIFARPLKEISFGQLLLRLFQTARRFNMQIQPQLVLLQKTLLNIEGLGRDLYPDLDLWQTAKPILEQWMKEKLGWQAAVKSLQKEAPTWAETLPTLPRMLHDLTKQAQAGQLHMQLSSKDLDKIRQEVRHSSYRTAAAVSGAALIVGAAIIKGLDGYSSNMLAGMPVLSWILGLWGGLMLYFSLRRSD